MQTLAYLTYTQSKYKPTRKISLKNDLNRQKSNKTTLGVKLNLQQKKRQTKVDLKKPNEEGGWDV